MLILWVEIVVGEIVPETCGKRAQLCNELILEVEEAKQLILSFPMTWSKIGKNQRKFVLKKFPYMIIYKIYCDRILIAAFAHQHRKPYYYVK